MDHKTGKVDLAALEGDRGQVPGGRADDDVVRLHVKRVRLNVICAFTLGVFADDLNGAFADIRSTAFLVDGDETVMDDLADVELVTEEVLVEPAHGQLWL